MTKESFLLDGRRARDILSQEIAGGLKKVKKLPQIVVLLIGENKASEVFVREKVKFGKQLGILVEIKRFAKNVSEPALCGAITKLNKDYSVGGIILQLPLPEHLNRQKIINQIGPEKDIDGLTAKNLAALYLGEFSKGEVRPATARGVLAMLKFYKIKVSGKKVLIIGRSNLVGKAVALSLLSLDATITVGHRKTKNLAELCRESEVVISAAGSPKFLKEKFFKKGTVVIDIGTTAVLGKLVGDVENLSSGKKFFRTPVPGGVGPMTILGIFANFYDLLLGRGLVDKKLSF